MARILIILVLALAVGCSTVPFHYDPYVVYKQRGDTWVTTKDNVDRYRCRDSSTQCDVFIGRYTCSCMYY